jgi:hypothetical protein
MPEGHAGTIAVFYHDVEAGLARRAIAYERPQAEATGHEPWPLDAWPPATTHVVICRDDRIFPADWLRDVVLERLSIEPDELPGGHTPALSRPGELVDLLESYRT